MGTNLTETDAQESIQVIFRENAALKIKVAQLERSLEDYRTEKSDDKELLKKLEIFKPLLNDNAITHQVWLRDPALITTLKAKAIQWYGTGVDANSKDKIIAKNARNIIETIVEECIRYGILTVPQLMHGILKNKK